MQEREITIKVYSAGWLQKAMALIGLCGLYVIVRHAGKTFAAFQGRHIWYASVALIPVLAILFYSCMQALIWQVPLNTKTIQIRSLSGIRQFSISDIIRLERRRGRWVGGRLRLFFFNHPAKVVPAIVGDLDDLSNHIERYLGDRHTPRLPGS